MTTIMEIACEKCQRPLISPGPANQTQQSTTYMFYITNCKHFYHKSCVRDLYNSPTSHNSEEPFIFMCQNQKCAAPVKHDQIFTIVPTLVQSREIDPVCSKPDENSKQALKNAQDTINQLKKKAQQNANDLSIARNRIVELESKLNDANALYQKTIKDKTCRLVHQHSNQTGTNTKVQSATSGIPNGNTKQKIPTLPKAKQPTKTTTKELSITEVNHILRTIASQTPKSTKNQNTSTNNTAPSQSTTYSPSRITKLPANKESDAKPESKRNNPASSSIIDRSYSPAKRSVKREPTDQIRPCHVRFQKRFKMSSEILKPFYPLDCYPLQYTAAGIRYKDEVPKTAILAKDILMIGDGLIYGMVQFISTAIPFEFHLHPKLYRRDLKIKDLADTLNSFQKLPARIMLSIGNWDAFNCIRKETFYSYFQKLLRIFQSRRVKELYLMPLIRHTAQDSSASSFTYVDSVFQVNWGNTFGGKYMLMNPEPFFENLHPVVDQFGPMFEIEQYEPYVVYLREELIPSASENPSDDEVMDLTLE